MKTKATLLIKEERELKITPPPTLGKILFRSFFWLLLVIMESYLWIFKWSDLVSWVKDLEVLWIGLAIGSIGTILFYIYCYWKRYVIKIRKRQRPSIYSIFAMVVTIIRACELIMIVTHFQQFLGFWADGILPFILFSWIVSMAVMAFVRANFLRKRRAHRQRSQQHQQHRSHYTA